MPVSAHDVAAVIRAEIPGVGVKKLHKLLYYAQGFHLLHTGQSLFRETICAWDMGPVVAALWRAEKHGLEPPPRTTLGEVELNTIGYVVSRYGSLTGKDLENLTHNEPPWRSANLRRNPGESVDIDNAWIRDFFAELGYATGEDDDYMVDSAVVAQWLRDAESHRTTTKEPDDLAALVARLAACA